MMTYVGLATILSEQQSFAMTPLKYKLHWCGTN